MTIPTNPDLKSANPSSPDASNNVDETMDCTTKPTPEPTKEDRAHSLERATAQIMVGTTGEDPVTLKCGCRMTLTCACDNPDCQCCENHQLKAGK